MVQNALQRCNERCKPTESTNAFGSKARLRLVLKNSGAAWAGQEFAGAAGRNDLGHSVAKTPAEETHLNSLFYTGLRSRLLTHSASSMRRLVCVFHTSSCRSNRCHLRCSYSVCPNLLRRLFRSCMDH